MKERVLVLLACLFASFTLAMAQSRTVRGTVADEAGDPIIGASVLVKGTNTGTITDIDGAFVLSNVPSNASTLVISYVGMKTQEVAIANNVQVVMANDAEMLEEVVVTGYGSQRKASFTGAATVVGQEAISRKTDANFVKSLEGTVTGLTMSNSTSMPGTWASVNIRGLGSLSSNDQPLYVIDGMPVNSDSDTMSSSSPIVLSMRALHHVTSSVWMTNLRRFPLRQLSLLTTAHCTMSVMVMPTIVCSMSALLVTPSTGQTTSYPDSSTSAVSVSRRTLLYLRSATTATTTLRTS